MSGWRLEVAAPAERSLVRLPESVAAAKVQFMLRPFVESPQLVGKPLQRELEGYWSARRGAYRVIYRLDEGAHRVIVLRIDHRAGVYRRR